MGANNIILRFVSISFSILILLLIGIGLIRVGEYCYGFGFRVFTEPPMAEEPGEDIVVLLTDDMSELEVGQMLEEKNLIRDSYLFYTQLKLSAYSGKLLSGTYVLNTSMTPREMMIVLSAGQLEDTETEEPSEEEPTESLTDGTEMLPEGTEMLNDTQDTEAAL